VHVLEPEQASKTINQIGDVLQKKLKGKPVGEAIGRILGGVRIGNDRGNGGGGQNAKPPANQEEPDEEGPPESDQGRDPTSTISALRAPASVKRRRREILTLPANSES
jgi:hypothetical protein